MKKGRQDHVTPMEFIEAVNNRWQLWFDLAATHENSRAVSNFGYQLDGSFSDSFKQDWHLWQKEYEGCGGRYFWLNPGFSGTGPWMKKCRDESRLGARIVSLTLADTGTCWYRDYVEGNALTLILRGRITFEGEKYPHVKECMINVWDGKLTGYGYWDWKKDI